MHPTRLIAITGASGGGKSTILSELAARGQAVQPEIGRMIVREEMPDGALPWTQPMAFRDLFFDRSVATYDRWAAERPTGPVFFDRTFIEAIAWSRSTGTPVPDEMEPAARTRRFAQPVFICPPWPEIYPRTPSASMTSPPPAPITRRTSPPMPPLVTTSSKSPASPRPSAPPSSSTLFPFHLDRNIPAGGEGLSRAAPVASRAAPSRSRRR